MTGWKWQRVEVVVQREQCFKDDTLFIFSGRTFIHQPERLRDRLAWRGGAQADANRHDDRVAPGQRRLGGCDSGLVVRGDDDDMWPKRPQWRQRIGEQCHLAERQIVDPYNMPLLLKQRSDIPKRKRWGDNRMLG